MRSCGRSWGLLAWYLPMSRRFRLMVLLKRRKLSEARSRTTPSSKTIRRVPTVFAVGALFSITDEGLAERDDDTARGCIQDLDEGNEESIDSSQQAEVSANCAATQTADEIAEVSCR